jgi:hypothetical protein
MITDNTALAPRIERALAVLRAHGLALVPSVKNVPAVQHALEQFRRIDDMAETFHREDRETRDLIPASTALAQSLALQEHTCLRCRQPVKRGEMFCSAKCCERETTEGAHRLQRRLAHLDQRAEEHHAHLARRRAEAVGVLRRAEAIALVDQLGRDKLRHRRLRYERLQQRLEGRLQRERERAARIGKQLALPAGRTAAELETLHRGDVTARARCTTLDELLERLAARRLTFERAWALLRLRESGERWKTEPTPTVVCRTCQLVLGPDSIDGFCSDVCERKFTDAGGPSTAVRICEHCGRWFESPASPVLVYDTVHFEKESWPTPRPANVCSASCWAMMGSDEDHAPEFPAAVYVAQAPLSLASRALHARRAATSITPVAAVTGRPVSVDPDARPPAVVPEPSVTNESTIELDRKVRNALNAARTWLSQKQLFELIDARHGSVLDSLARLVAQGIIQRRGLGVRGSSFEYFVPGEAIPTGKENSAERH